MKNIIIAWDVGTSANKASLYDSEGNCLAQESVGYPTYYSANGWHEQAPADWWWAVKESTRRLLLKTGINKNEIIGCGISGHSMSCVLLDANGCLLAERIPIWSDDRASKESATFFEQYDRNRWYAETGAGTKPGEYPIFKLCWYREHRPDLFKRIDKVVGTSDYINYLLTGKLTISESNAVGSGGYSILKKDFSNEILLANGLSRALFPHVVQPTEIIGTLCPTAAEQLGLSCNTLVTAGGTDTVCMAIGADCHTQGKAYMALGTSCWIAWTGERPIIDSESYPYVFPLCDGLFNSGLSIASGGSAYSWMKNELCKDLETTKNEDSSSVYNSMEALARQSPPGANGLLFNPCLSGGMPIDPGPNMRGGFLGLQLRHTRADLLRATLEGVVFKLRECKESLERDVCIGKEILIVGGGCKNSLWLQILADCLNITVLKSNIDEQTAALGAAAIAAVGTGIWDGFSRIGNLHRIQNRLLPISENTKVYDALFKIYRKSNKYMAELGSALEGIGM